MGCGDSAPSIETITVEAQTFRHEVGADGLLEASKQTPVTVPSEVRGSVRIAWLAPEGAVEEGELVAQFDARPFQEGLADAHHDLGDTSLETTKTRAGASSRRAETEKERQVAEIELARAETYGASDDEIFSRREIIESEIDAELARERRRQAVAGASTDERLASAELAILSVREREATRRGDEAEQGLAALEVRAPHGGVFVPARNWRGEPLQVGHEVWQGRPIGEIPDLAAVRARVYVLEADAGGIKPGAVAEVVVDARPDRVLAATVESIEPVAKPRLRGSPVQFFGVVLAFEDPSDVGRPGQRVRARLRLADVDDAITVPRQAIEREGDQAFVWVLDDDEPSRRAVTLGPASLGRVVIAEGLAVGERVLLEPPSRAAELARVDAEDQP
jgi:RND family efflux transporter MFP subunit